MDERGLLIPRIHKEAYCRLLLYAFHVTKQDNHQIIVQSDTVVVVLTVSVSGAGLADKLSGIRQKEKLLIQISIERNHYNCSVSKHTGQ